MKGEETSEIDIAAIHYDEGSGFDGENVQGIQIVALSAGNIDEGGDEAVNVDQGMKLYGGLGFPEFGPGEEIQTQIDGGGIKSVNGRVEIKTNIGVGIKLARNINQ